MGKPEKYLFPESLQFRLHERREPRIDPAFLGLLLKGLRCHGSETEKRAICDAVDQANRDPVHDREDIYPPHDRFASHCGIGRGRRYKRRAERIVPSN